MKFKKVHKVLAAVLSVLTMMPNCYQLESGKTEKAKSSQSKQKAGGDVGFLSKNTTMTVGERIVKDIVLVLGALGVGGVIASKCSGKKDITSSNTVSSSTSTTTQRKADVSSLSGISLLLSPPVDEATVEQTDYGYNIAMSQNSSSLPLPHVDKATVTQTDYGYNIENSIARVVLFSAKDRYDFPALWMMYELKTLDLFVRLPYQVVKELLCKQFTPIELLYKGSMGSTDRRLPSPSKAVFSLAGFPSETIGVIIKHIKDRGILPEFSGPLNGKTLDPENVLDNLHTAIVLGFGDFIKHSSSYLQGQLQPLNTGDSKTTHDLLNMFLNTQAFTEDYYYTPPTIPNLETNTNYYEYSPSLPDLMNDIIVNNKIAFFPLRHYYEVSRELNKLKAFNYILSDKQNRSTILNALDTKYKAFKGGDALLASQNSNASTLCDYLTADNPSETIEKIAKPSPTEILRVFENVKTASEALKKEIDNCCTKGGEPSAEKQLDFVCKMEAQSHDLCLCEKLYPEFDYYTHYGKFSSLVTSFIDGKGEGTTSFMNIKKAFDEEVEKFSGIVSALESRSKGGSDDNNDDDDDDDDEKGEK